MDRDTKEIKTGNHTFVVKTYATAREYNAIQQAYFTGTKVEIVGDAPRINEINPGVMFEVHQELVRQAVVSMDGDPANVVERCLELPNDEFQELVGQLDEIVTKKKS